MMDNTNTYRFFDVLVELNNALVDEGRTLPEIAQALSMEEQTLLEDLGHIQAAIALRPVNSNKNSDEDVLKEAKENKKAKETEEIKEAEDTPMDGFMLAAGEEDDLFAEKTEKWKKKLLNNPELTIKAGYGTRKNYLYVSLTNGEYDAVNKFAQGHHIDTLLDGEELYKVHHDFNNYEMMNREKHRQIRKAIAENRMIIFRRGEETKKVFPIMIYQDVTFGYAYMMSYGSNEFYRIDRMQEIDTDLTDPKNKLIVLKEKMNKGERQRREKMIAYKEEHGEELRKKLNSIWGPSGGENEVKFKVYNDNGGAVIRKVMRDLQPYIDHAGYDIQTDEEGNLIVTGTVIGTSDFERYVRSYGASIVVISPESMRKSICQSAQDRLRDLGVAEEDIPKL